MSDVSEKPEIVINQNNLLLRILHKHRIIHYHYYVVKPKLFLIFSHPFVTASLYFASMASENFSPSFYVREFFYFSNVKPSDFKQYMTIISANGTSNDFLLNLVC